MAEPRLLKMVEAVIDDRTTQVCLHAAGQVRQIDEPFDTLTGQYQAPPFHRHCRSIVVAWVPGMVQPARDAANAELQRRPTDHVITRGPRKGQKVNQRRLGPPHRNERRTLYPTAKPGIFTEVPLPPAAAPVANTPAVSRVLAPATPNTAAVVAKVPIVVADDPVLGAGALARIRGFLAQRQATRAQRALAALGRLVDVLRRRGD